MRVALAQLDPTVGDKAKNLKKLEAVVASAQADLLLTGELFLSGYMARDAFAHLAEPLDGPAVKAATSIAQEHSTHLIFGMPEREEATKRQAEKSYSLPSPINMSSSPASKRARAAAQVWRIGVNRQPQLSMSS